MIGAFPPPVNGLSAASAAMRVAYEQAGGAVRVLDTAAGDIGPPLPPFLSKIARRFAALYVLVVGLFANRRRAQIYMALSGGKGQYVDIIYIGVARLFAVPIILHHHSFSYLDRPSKIATVLFQVAGRRALHITLCDRMNDLLRQRYLAVERTIVLSNVALTEMAIDAAPRIRPLRVLGFLSNIASAKGIDRFLLLVAKLRTRNMEIIGHVAGPIESKECRSLVEAAVAAGLIVYHGPVYGERKKSFFAGIDVLVFPSRYVNEAEPFVILEAFASGVPVIGTARGCIPSLIDESNGLLLDASAEDLEPAIGRIANWIALPEEFTRTREQVILRVIQLSVRARKAKESLMNQFLAVNAA
jgi:glycosyltransferase involved in cell wall biosynthesis